MHTLIEKYFLKRKIDQNTLSAEEKKTFDDWQSRLTGSELTVEKMRDFLHHQKALIEEKWADTENSTQKNERLIIYHTIYSKILKMMSVSENERIQIERHLEELIDKTEDSHL